MQSGAQGRRVGQIAAERCRARENGTGRGQSRAEHGRARKSGAEQGRVRQNEGERNRARESGKGRGRAGQGRAAKRGHQGVPNEAHHSALICREILEAPQSLLKLRPGGVKAA